MVPEAIRPLRCFPLKLEGRCKTDDGCSGGFQRARIARMLVCTFPGRKVSAFFTLCQSIEEPSQNAYLRFHFSRAQLSDESRKHSGALDKIPPNYE